MMTRNWIRHSLTIAALGAIAGTTQAEGYQPEHSLKWPLVDLAEREPRPALGSTFGEFQSYGDDSKYLHTGIDIRGRTGDPVRLVAGGNIWFTKNFSEDKCESNVTCRLYVKGDDGRYIYYYSHLRLYGDLEETTSQVRDAIVNAMREDPGYPVQADTEVEEGKILAGIAAFGDSEQPQFHTPWHHLHFSIIDSAQNYDAIHPLTALDRSGPRLLNDEERPWFMSPDVDNDFIRFVEDGTTTAVEPVGDCDELSDTGPLDIIAFAKDSFVSSGEGVDDVDGRVNSIGVYDASYTIRNVATGDTIGPVTWYDFTSAPLECPGSPDTRVCAEIDKTRFFEFSIEQLSGAVTVGDAYATTLYNADMSCTSWTPGSGYDCSGFADGETYAHVLTNSWGEDGSFDPSLLDDGLYQVSVEVFDDAGNGRSVTEFVSVNNSGVPLTPGSAQPDVYVRDNQADVGAIPSTLGGEPFWTSPDVMVFAKGTAGVTVDSNPGSGQVEAGITYDVYVRVQNDHCASVDDIKVQIYSADPSTLNTQDDWISITPEGVFVGDPANPNGLDLGPSARGLVGPFEWTPTAAETSSSDGHRCLLAYIDAPSDRLGPTLAAVKDDNNAAQRNIQVSEAGTAFMIINPQGNAADVGLEFSGYEFPVRDPESLVELTVQYHPSLAAGWSDVPGATYHRDIAHGTMVFEFDAKRVSFPPVTLPALTRLPASVELALPSGVEGEHIVHFAETLDGDVRGGMSFSISGAPIIH